ncbi:hypothetical protein Tco_0796713 [Tanacetum coccineum]
MKVIHSFRQVCEDVEVHAKDAQEEAQEKRLEALENVVQQIRQNGTWTTPNYQPEPSSQPLDQPKHLVQSTSGIDTQMLNQIFALPRSSEALAAVAVTHALQAPQDGDNLSWNLSSGISNVAEGDRVKFASSTLLDSALSWLNVYVHSITLNVAHTTH